MTRLEDENIRCVTRPRSSPSGIQRAMARASIALMLATAFVCAHSPALRAEDPPPAAAEPGVAPAVKHVRSACSLFLVIARGQQVAGRDQVGHRFGV